MLAAFNLQKVIQKIQTVKMEKDELLNLTSSYMFYLKNYGALDLSFCKDQHYFFISGRRSLILNLLTNSNQSITRIKMQWFNEKLG